MADTPTTPYHYDLWYRADLIECYQHDDGTWTFNCNHPEHGSEGIEPWEFPGGIEGRRVPLAELLQWIERHKHEER